MRKRIFSMAKYAKTSPWPLLTQSVFHKIYLEPAFVNTKQFTRFFWSYCG